MWYEYPNMKDSWGDKTDYIMFIDENTLFELGLCKGTEKIKLGKANPFFKIFTLDNVIKSQVSVCSRSRENKKKKNGVVSRDTGEIVCLK